MAAAFRLLRGAGESGAINSEPACLGAGRFGEAAQAGGIGPRPRGREGESGVLLMPMCVDDHVRYKDDLRCTFSLLAWDCNRAGACL